MWTNDEVNERGVWTFDEVESEEYEGENGSNDESDAGVDAYNENSGGDGSRLDVYSPDTIQSVEAQPLLLTEREAQFVDEAIILFLEETNVETGERIRRTRRGLASVQERLRIIYF